VVAAEPAEGLVVARRVEGAHLDARLAQRAPEPARSLPDGAEPVVDDPHAHALARLRLERVGEPVADFVLVEDEALEVNRPARGRDGVEPRRVVLLGVLQEPHVVAADERRAGRPLVRLIDEASYLRAFDPFLRVHLCCRHAVHILKLTDAHASARGAVPQIPVARLGASPT
jgi:hypothetical protein